MSTPKVASTPEKDTDSAAYGIARDGVSDVPSPVADSKRDSGSLSAARRLLLAGFAMLPWLAALFLLYLLESRAFWQAEEPLRAPISVTVLATGMALSFLLHSRLHRGLRRHG